MSAMVMPNASRQIGPYEIQALVGAGGMGVVYRARDTRLGRDVAIKVLLPEAIDSATAAARFEREARSVAALSHPNILTIHDFGTHEGSVYAVMELLDGPTLRTMLERGPLPVRKTVALGVQIARGLAAAHTRGIVHRDLKPENIGVMRTGQVKILDFGLARNTAASLAAANTETHAAISTTGLVVGTVGYMAPEQVRGEDVDERSDIFALGVVLHEMLTSRCAFSRATAADTIAAILNDEPADFQQVGANVPPPLERVVRRCLEKHPEDRFQSARDLAFALENSLAPTSGELPAARRRPRFPILPVALVAGGVAIGAVASAVWPRAAIEPQSVHFLTSSGTDSEPTVSPAGDEVVYTSERGGESTLWLREIDGGSSAIVERPLPLAGAHRPRFFADGRRVLFLQASGASQSAFRMNKNGGNPELILDDVTDAEPSPTDADEIAFVRLGFNASGGRVARLGVFNGRTRGEESLLEESGVDYIQARWSPDGARVATIRRSSATATQNSIVVVARKQKTRVDVKPDGPGTFGALAWNGDGRTIIATQSQDAQVFVPGVAARIFKIDATSGERQLLLKQDNLFGLMGTAWANATIDLAGDGRLVMSSIEIHQNLRGCAVSDNGCVDIAPGQGRVASTTGYSNDRQPAYSPDGDFVVFSSNRSGNQDLWIQSTKDGTIRQLTHDAELDWDPAFTPDGKHILWSSRRRSDHLEIWMADFDRAGLEQGAPANAALLNLHCISSDGVDAENPTMTPKGEWVVYSSSNTTKAGIWRIRPDGGNARNLVPGALHYIPDVSPDGRYIAYLLYDPVHMKNMIRVVDIETGHDSGFEIVVPYGRQATRSDVLWGRPRWSPTAGGLALLFIGQDEGGRAAVYKQAFHPGTDTSATRQRLVASLPGGLTESLMMSPDGRFITVSDGYYVRRLMLAEHVPGIIGRRRAP